MEEEERPLMFGAATDEENGMDENDDNINNNDVIRGYDVISQLNDPDTPEELKHKKRLQSYNLLGISLTALLWTAAFPIHYNDIAMIWTESLTSSFNNTTFLAYLAFLLSYTVSTYLCPIVIPFLGAKRTIMLGMSYVMVYLVANFFTIEWFKKACKTWI